MAGGAIQSTARPGDEAVLAQRAIDDGATTIVAVGGDGTWSNVANAIEVTCESAALRVGGALPGEPG